MKLTAACSTAIALGALFLVTDSARAAGERAYSARMPILTVAGTPVTMVRSIEGGNLVGDGVVEPRSAEQGKLVFPKRRLGPLRVEPLSVEVGLDRTLDGWISDAFNGSTAPKGVGLSFVDLNRTETGRVELTATRVVEVDFPALDASIRDAYYTHVVLQPEAMRRSPGAGTAPAVAATPQHSQLVANFRVTVGTLPCARVSKVSAITVKTAPGGFSVSNLVLSISAVDLKAWQEWQDMSMKVAVERPDGNDAQEKTGTIELLGPDMSTVTARLSFRGLGLVRLALDKLTANTDVGERFTAEMYVEDIKFAMP